MAYTFGQETKPISIMIETVASGVLLALMSGACFLAYTHTGRFRHVIPWLFGASFLFMLLGVTWNSALGTAHITVLRASSDTLPAKELSAINSAVIPWYLLSLPWFLIGVLWLLTHLFGYLRYEGEKKDPEQPMLTEDGDALALESVATNKRKVKQPRTHKE